MKKKIAAVLAAAVCLLMASCQKAEVTSAVTITDEAGAGTRTISFSFPEDKKTVIDRDDDGVEYHIYNNETYFPKGIEAFADFIASRLPAEGGYTYQTETADTGDIVVTLSYSFSSFEEYAEKTKGLMGEERWNKGEFLTPQVFVTRVNDPESENYGKLRVTYAESHYFTSACVAGIMERGFCQEAVDQGLLLPYGDAFSNADCRQMFVDYNPSEKTFEAFADVYFLTGADRACEETGERSYAYLDSTFVSSRGEEGLCSCFVIDDGSLSLTDVTPFLPEGETEGELYVDEEGVWVLTPKEDTADDGLWSLEKFDKTKVILGKKTPSASGDEKLTEPEKDKSPLGWILAGVGVAAAVGAIVIVLAVKKRADEEEEEDEDGDDEPEDEA